MVFSAVPRVARELVYIIYADFYGIMGVEFRAMPVWFWVINPVLWAVSVCLTVFSIRFLLKGVRDLRRAKWSKYAEDYEEFLDAAKKRGKEYKEIIEKYHKMIADTEDLLGNKTSPQHIPNLAERLEELRNKLGGSLEEYSTNLDQRSDLLDNLGRFTRLGGIAGFSMLHQIEATKNIAIAAVLMALSSIGFSISGVISAIAG